MSQNKRSQLRLAGAFGVLTLLLVSICLVALYGCGGGVGGGPTPPQQVTLSGKVVDATDPTNGVDGLTVELYQHQPPKGRQQSPIASTKTGNGGLFQLKVAAGQNYLTTGASLDAKLSD